MLHISWYLDIRGQWPLATCAIPGHSLEEKQSCVGWLFEKESIVNGGLDLWAKIASKGCVCFFWLLLAREKYIYEGKGHPYRRCVLRGSGWAGRSPRCKWERSADPAAPRSPLEALGHGVLH